MISFMCTTLHTCKLQYKLHTHTHTRRHAYGHTCVTIVHDIGQNFLFRESFHVLYLFSKIIPRIYHIYILQGGFAKCYEITESKSHHVYAGKIVPKSLMTKSNQREKMTQEIAIHQTLNHRHIVGFHGFFDDAHNIYIILELCRKRVGIPALSPVPCPLSPVPCSLSPSVLHLFG